MSHKVEIVKKRVSYEVVVSKGVAERRIIIPYTYDQKYDEYLIEAEVEKAVNELNRLEPREKMAAPKRKEIGKALKEYKGYGLRRAGSSKNRIYYEGGIS